MATAKKRGGFDIDEVPDNRGGDLRKPTDMVDLYALPEKKYVKLRFFGDIFAYGGHWLETKKKDGSKGSFYHPCAAFDLATGKLDSTKRCAFCDDDSGFIRFNVDYFVNAINRKEQQNAPEKIRVTAAESESGFKSKDSESWTPVKAVRLTNSVLRRLKELRQLNVHEIDGESMNYPVLHPKYGVDVSVKKDKELPPANQYEVQIGQPTPLKKIERGYLIWDLSELMLTPSEEAVQAEYKKWAVRMGLVKTAKKPVEGAEDDDDDVPKKKVVKKPAAEDFDDEDDAPKKKSKAKPAAEDDDDDDDDDDETPKAKKSSKSSAAADDFDDEEEEAPPKKKKAAPSEDEDEEEEAPKPKKKAAPVDDEDEDEAPKKKVAAKKAAADDDFDDEDDAPPPKKKVAKKAVEEEEEDEAPPKKVAKKVAKKAVEEEEEEEEEAPKPKKKVAKKAVDEDDDFAD